MTATLIALAWVIAVAVSILFAVWCIEVALGALPATTGRDHPAPQPTPDTVILMPAHNEAQGIGATIMALKPHLGERVRLLVIADNCTDTTAQVARAAGAQVLERQDAQARGKGHALAFGQAHLRSDPPAVVIVLDADCTVDAGGIAALANQALMSGRPVQGLYLMQPTAQDSPMVQISNFAFLIKNMVRQRGGARIGAAAILGGTGMAFPWALFETLPLATSNLVEDLALGIHCTQAGKPPIFFEGARIATLPASEADTLGQRTRWEHGFVATATRQGIPLIAQGLVRISPRLLWMGLHLMVPPLALLMVIGGISLSALLGLGLLGAGYGPLLCLLAMMLLAGIALGIAWQRNGRQTISGGTLLAIPRYIVWKLGIYRRLFGRQETQWVRTKRLDE